MHSLERERTGKNLFLLFLVFLSSCTTIPPSLHVTPTNRDLLQLMIAISDNTAADRFIDLFGAEAVNARMAALCLPGIRLVGRIPNKGQEPSKWPPLGVMTPRDTAELYRRVAARTLLDPASDRLIARLLATQHTRDRLPRLLLDENGTSRLPGDGSPLLGPLAIGGRKRSGRLWQFVSLEHRAWHAGSLGPRRASSRRGEPEA
jgi:hypothetical protein